MKQKGEYTHTCNHVLFLAYNESRLPKLLFLKSKFFLCIDSYLASKKKSEKWLTTHLQLLRLQQQQHQHQQQPKEKYQKMFDNIQGIQKSVPEPSSSGAA